MPKGFERSGDFDELLLQLLISESWRVLEKQGGIYWFLLMDLEPGDGLKTAHLTALELMRRVSEKPKLWENSLFWKIQRPAIERGLFWSTEVFAAKIFKQYLEEKNISRDICFLVIDDNWEHLENFIKLWRQQMEGSSKGGGKNLAHTLFHINGPPETVFQKLNYLWLNGPGLVLLRFKQPMDKQWFSILEALLYRNLTVLVSIDYPFSYPKFLSYFSRQTNWYKISLPALIYKVKRERRKLFWKELSIWGEKKFLEELEKKINPFISELNSIYDRESIKVRSEFINNNHEKKPNSRWIELSDGKRALLKPGSIEEMEFVLDLWEKLMDEHFLFDTRFRRRELGRMHMRYHLTSQLMSDEFLLMTAKVEGEVVGFMTAQIVRNPIFLPPLLGQISDAYILPEWRSKGLGSAMVEMIIQWFRENKVQQVDLNVAIANKAGKKFWEKHGFTPYLQIVSKWL